MELGLDGNVEFVGYVPYGPKLFDEYLRADIFVLPPIGTEGWSRVLIEANAHGLPTVTTDVGSLGRSTREFESGLVVRPGSAVEIANAVATIIRDGDLRRRLIKGSLSRAAFHTRSQEEERVWRALAAAYPEFVRQMA
jgi:glycosyltransferase involved in cell wall biosynthesis